MSTSSAPTSYQQRAAREQQTAELIRLLHLLASRGIVAKATIPHHCGCPLFAQVSGGWRCLYCWPPLDLPPILAEEIARTRQ